MAATLIDFPTQHSKQVVSELMEKEDFVNFKTTVSAGSSKGDNYLGEMYRVKIEGKKKDGKVSTISLIIKAAPKSEVAREKMELRKLFKTEVYAYTTLLPAFDKLQLTSTLKEEEKFKYAKCYYCSMNDMEELLVMGDLSIDGFTMYDRKTSLDMPHAKLAVSRLAQFHSLSIVMKKFDQTKFNLVKKELPEQFFVRSKISSLKDYLAAARDKAVASIDNAVYREKLKTYTEDMFNNITDLLKTSDDTHFVLCHGDSWTNNFLFNYKDGKPVDIRLLDWQVIRYSSPVTDLLYMMYACTDSDFRAAHYDELLKYYYSEMERFLEKFSIKAEEVYPSKVFHSDLKKFALFGMGMAIMTLLLFTCESDDTPNIDELLDGSMNTDFSKGESAVLYNSRINGVVSDFIKYGYM